jgi:hypothetical protein
MLNPDTIVWKLAITNEKHRNITMKLIVQEIMVDGWKSIPILKKLQVRIYLHTLNSSFKILLLGYTNKDACEAASTSRYKYKWARKYPMIV